MLYRNVHNELRPISKEDLIYLAGFLDGEGTLTIVRVKRRGKIDYRPTVGAANTNKDVLDWIYQITGVGTVVKGHKPEVPGRKQLWQYRCWSSNAVQLAELLYPFLKVKKLQASILVEFGKTLLRDKLPYRVPEQTWSIRSDMASEISLLNKLGKEKEN